MIFLSSVWWHTVYTAEILLACSSLHASRTHPKLSSPVILMHWYYLSGIWGTTHKPDQRHSLCKIFSWLLVVLKCSNDMSSIKKQASNYEVIFYWRKTFFFGLRSSNYMSIPPSFVKKWLTVQSGCFIRSVGLIFTDLSNLLLITPMVGKPVLLNFHNK